MDFTSPKNRDDDARRRRASGTRIAQAYHDMNTRRPSTMVDLAALQRLGILALCIVALLATVAVARAVTFAPIKARADLAHFERGEG